MFANTLIWDEDGKYVGFDAEEFTSQSGGKARAVAHIRQSHGYETVVAIGDGATDLEVRARRGGRTAVGQADGWVDVRAAPHVDTGQCS